ncbi:SCP2 sterol-binding domain-containing protein [Pontibacter sp. G13]|uniref:SCP2 sterol-binding domain-containing protein n=1 Tax=Pontibacter sp. G13 TaxID=3074898 RepID=UPI00288AFE40|nr:SCP2 sterol-binding domain-containing protein [Pontibacter sp. G13]WNJ16062.1 SCP2 sterol-binding domain-containing protein [Pontibacter sp. G13]
MSLDATTANVKKMAEAADALGSTIKFSFADGAGVIFLDGTQDPTQVHNQDLDADCTINIQYDDFQEMINGDLNPMAAFMGGKMKIDGDMGVAMKLSSMFS